MYRDRVLHIAMRRCVGVRFAVIAEELGISMRQVYRYRQTDLYEYIGYRLLYRIVKLWPTLPLNTQFIVGFKLLQKSWTKTKQTDDTEDNYGVNIKTRRPLTEKELCEFNDKVKQIIETDIRTMIYRFKKL